MHFSDFEQGLEFNSKQILLPSPFRFNAAMSTILNLNVLQLARIRMRLSFSSISQPRVHQFQLSLWPSSRGGPEVSKTPPTCKIWIILIDKFVQNTSKSSIISKHCFFGSAITWLKIIRMLQIGGVLETSRPTSWPQR